MQGEWGRKGDESGRGREPAHTIYVRTEDVNVKLKRAGQDRELNVWTDGGAPIGGSWEAGFQEPG